LTLTLLLALVASGCVIIVQESQIETNNYFTDGVCSYIDGNDVWAILFLEKHVDAAYCNIYLFHRLYNNL
jgi:hypothetical protein